MVAYCRWSSIGIGNVKINKSHHPIFFVNQRNLLSFKSLESLLFSISLCIFDEIFMPGYIKEGRSNKGPNLSKNSKRKKHHEKKKKFTYNPNNTHSSSYIQPVMQEQSRSTSAKEGY